MALRLDSKVEFIKGVGPKLGLIFQDHDIRTVQDLLWYLPRTYERQRVLEDLVFVGEGQTVQVVGTILKSFSFRTEGRQVGSQFGHEILVQLPRGQVAIKFFRAPYRGFFQTLQPGLRVHAVGKVQSFRNRLELMHPTLDFVKPDFAPEEKIIPIYSEMGGLSSNRIRNLIHKAWQDLEEKEQIDVLNSDLQASLQLPNLHDALFHVHHPDLSWNAEWLDGDTPFRRRLAFEEFFEFYLRLQLKKADWNRQKGQSLCRDLVRSELLITEFKKQLPFTLTSSQEDVSKVIFTDLKGSHPMHRLIQGDVGSGKTVVAFLGALHAVANGAQVALMAPTEILAEQHFLQAQKWLSPLGLSVCSLMGKTKTAERKKLLLDLENHKVDLLIGTHALIEDDVRFSNLGLVIIDEQHRFGVQQRGRLQAKGTFPHVMIMTATPIPRTLAMTLYGDLNVSWIREKPAGRQPIQTRATAAHNRGKALEFLRDQIKKGRQAYMIFPLIEDSEKLQLKNATDEFIRLQALYPDVRFRLLHGRHKPEEKEATMREFRDGFFDVLISTTVIEVGVDVPNANLMFIEHAERFGLSQLHQLRGRVGRGQHKSYCICILSDTASPEAFERVQFLERSDDGLVIAEKDLEIRGPGEFMGARQSGSSGFRVASLVRDQDLLVQAQAAAQQVLEDHRLESKKKIKDKVFRKPHRYSRYLEIG